MEEPLRNMWDQFAACDDSVTNKLYPRLASQLWHKARYRVHYHHRATLEIQDLITDVLVQHVWMKKREDKSFLLAIQSPIAYLMRILLFDYQDLVKSAEMVEHKIQEAGDKLIGYAEIMEPGWEEVYQKYVKNLPELSHTIWLQYIRRVSIDDIVASAEPGKPASRYLKQKTIEQIREDLRKLHRNYLNGEL